MHDSSNANEEDTASTNNDDQTENDQTQETTTEEENDPSVNEQEMEKREEVNDLITSIFENVYTYDEETYTNRFDELEVYATEEVMEQMQETAAGEIPDLEFESAVEDIKAYSSFDDTLDDLEMFVSVDIVYIMQDNEPIERTELMRMDVGMNDENEWEITQLEPYGAINPVEES